MAYAIAEFIFLGPGEEWGDEIPVMNAVADALAPTGRAVTVVADGGPVTVADLEAGVARGRPVVVLDGTGRTADRVAAAQRITTGNSRSGDARVGRLRPGHRRPRGRAGPLPAGDGGCGVR